MRIEQGQIDLSVFLAGHDVEIVARLDGDPQDRVPLAGGSRSSGRSDAGWPARGRRGLLLVPAAEAAEQEQDEAQTDQRPGRLTLLGSTPRRGRGASRALPSRRHPQSPADSGQAGAPRGAGWSGRGPRPVAARRTTAPGRSPRRGASANRPGAALGGWTTSILADALTVFSPEAGAARRSSGEKSAMIAVGLRRPRLFQEAILVHGKGGKAHQPYEEHRGQGRGQAKPPGRPPLRPGGDLADVLGRGGRRRVELRAEQTPEGGRIRLLTFLVRLGERCRGRGQVEAVAAAHQVLLETGFLVSGKLAAVVGDPLIGRGMVHGFRRRVDQLDESVMKVG